MQSSLVQTSQIVCLFVSFFNSTISIVGSTYYIRYVHSTSFIDFIYSLIPIIVFKRKEEVEIGILKFETHTGKSDRSEGCLKLRRGQPYSVYLNDFYN